MGKINTLLKKYLTEMGIKDDVSLGHGLPPGITEEKALEITKELHDQLQKQNRFGRVVNWVVLIMYSVLFGIILFAVLSNVFNIPQPYSILFGGGSIIASAVGIIKGIRNLGRESSLANTLILLSRNMEPENFAKAVDIVYQPRKKDKAKK